jgi:hypothetical protein
MNEPITRREALGRIGLLVGGALSASTVSAILGGCRAERTADGYAFHILDRDQQALTNTLVDLIIPETDTPGARAAGVPAFIDKMLADWMDDAERTRFLAGLADVDARARREHGARFVDLDPQQQVALLEELDREAFPPYEEPPAEEEADEAAAASNQAGTAAMAEGAQQEVGQVDSSATAAPAEEAPPLLFNTLKELTIAGYYTSEIGATQELQWSAAPGRYDADIPLSEVGRTWA